MSSQKTLTKEGQLYKYKNAWLGWGRRYFKLERSYFHYFETKHSPKPVATVTRGDISEVKACQQFAGKSNVFEVHSKSGVVWYLQAGSAEEMHLWMAALYPDGQFAVTSCQPAVSGPSSPPQVTWSPTSEPLIPAPYAPGHGPYDGPFPHIYPNLYAPSSPPYAPQVYGLSHIDGMYQSFFIDISLSTEDAIHGHTPPPSYEESAQASPLPSKAGQ